MIKKEYVYMKEKLKVILLIIMCLIYLLAAWQKTHNEWLYGVTKREEVIEERIIW